MLAGLETRARLALLLFAAWTCLTLAARADQVGIDKARLFEEHGGHYVLEVDTSPRFAAVYGNPVLPARFRLTDLRRERQPGYLVLRYEFHSLGDPLDGDDEVLLPWGRLGTAITAEWSDGSVHQNLFLRDFEGIRVPIRMLKPSEPSLPEVVWRFWQLGITHGTVGWNHWLLVVAVGLLCRGGWRIGLMGLFTAGHAISLVVAELGALVVPNDVAEICLAVVALLIARAAPLDAYRCGRFGVVMVILGLLHGTASARVLRQVGTNETDLVPALFMWNLGVDVVQVIGVVVVSACAIVVSRFCSRQASGWIAQAAVGGAAMGLLLIAFAQGYDSTGASFSPSQDSGQFELPGAQMVAGIGGPTRPPRLSTQPVAAFLAIEPFETRLEVLVRLADAGEWIETLAGRDLIEVSQQEQIKQILVGLIKDRTVVTIDGRDASPGVERADFVSVEPNGILSRPSPVEERRDAAIVGTTFVYVTDEMPHRVEIQWDLFSTNVETVLMTTTDPFGSKRLELTASAPQLKWENRWLAYRPAEIQPVEVARLRFPLASTVLVLLAAGLALPLTRGQNSRARFAATVSLLSVAWVLYPFVRTVVGNPFWSAWTPSAEQTAGNLDRLLTNIYRAYDMRDEESIYDRLALTVTGEQLTEIYLDTRRSLELENRGGARAKVNEVEILTVHSISGAVDGGLEIDLSWTVSGSVTHFGHTHYRRNRYRAVVRIVPMEGHWKIQSIDVREQQREL